MFDVKSSLQQGYRSRRLCWWKFGSRIGSSMHSAVFTQTRSSGCRVSLSSVPNVSFPFKTDVSNRSASHAALPAQVFEFLCWPRLCQDLPKDLWRGYNLRGNVITDPLGRPTVTAGCDHCFRTCCPSVPHFSKQNEFQAKTMFTTGETVGLAEWIIDDTCLIKRFFLKQSC